MVQVDGQISNSNITFSYGLPAIMTTIPEELSQAGGTLIISGDNLGSFRFLSDISIFIGKEECEIIADDDFYFDHHLIGCNYLPGNSFGSVGCNIGNAVTGTIMGVGNMFGAISDTISLGTMNF